MFDRLIGVRRGVLVLVPRSAFGIASRRRRVEISKFRRALVSEFHLLYYHTVFDSYAILSCYYMQVITRSEASRIEINQL